MTIVIDAVEKSTTGNCYVTLDEADLYLEAHLKASVWAATDTEVKKAALIGATRTIESEQYAGRRATQQQALSWPRTYIYDFDGYVVLTVPSKLKAVICELAVYNLTEDERLAGRFEIDTMDSVEIGPIKYKLKADAEYIPDFIEDMIEAIGPNVVADSNGGVTTMVL
jgi:hypothetical protein